MKGRKSILFCAVGLLALTSCNKDVVEIPESNDPVFRTMGTLGTDPFEIVAGDNGAYMFTMTEVQNGVDVFSGKISDGNFSIELGIYDGMIDKPSHEAVETIMNVISPEFSQVTGAPLVTLSKDELATMAGSQYVDQIVWSIDGIYEDLNEVVITEPGKYHVCADVTFLDGATASICNEVIAGYNLGANFMIDFSVGLQGLVTASVDNMGNAMQQVKWFVDENQVGSDDHLETEILSGYHIITAEVQFENGVVRRKSVLVDGSNQQHTVNDFTIFEYQASTTVKPRDFNIRLFVEKNGKKYTTETAKNEDAYLLITGLEYYGKNDAGMDVYKVSADIKAQVREVGTSNTIPMSFTTVFGIEIP
jgi:hypothetical protein